MRTIEKVLGGSIIILMTFRLLFMYPFAAILITFSSLLLSLLYLFFGFALFNTIKFRNIFKKKSYKGKSVLRILLSVFTGFTLSLLIIYILFKFQQWPYGNIGLLICLTWLGTLVIIISIKYLVSKNKFYANFLIRLIIVGVFGTLLYFVSSDQLLEMKYKNFPDYVAAEKALMKDPQNRYLQQKANQERHKMDLSNN